MYVPPAVTGETPVLRRWGHRRYRSGKGSLGPPAGWQPAPPEAGSAPLPRKYGGQNWVNPPLNDYNGGMECPKCRHQNPDTAQFCLRCHTPLRYVCPACRHVQLAGGKCEQCGVDFARYAMMLQFQVQSQAEQARRRSQTRTSILKQILLFPVTGGLSLLKFLRARLRGE